MASDLENLQTIRANLLARLAEMTAAPKPDYAVDGQAVSWRSLYESLWRQLQSVNEQLSIAEGPFEIHTRGIA